jgi:hypothetical protein
MAVPATEIDTLEDVDQALKFASQVDSNMARAYVDGLLDLRSKLVRDAATAEQRRETRVMAGQEVR